VSDEVLFNIELNLIVEA